MHTIQAKSRNYPLTGSLCLALVNTGARKIPDGNNGYPHGIAPYTENWRNAKRQPAGIAYSLNGVKVMTETSVQHITIERRSDKTMAVGVQLSDGKCLSCSKEVIVSCGALRMPQLLLLSGIGPKAILEEFKIAQVLDSPSVGQNIHDHVVVPLYWRLQKPEQGLAAGSEAFNSPAFQEGTPADYILTASAPHSDMKRALYFDGHGQHDHPYFEPHVPDDHPYLKPPRGHYEVLFCYAPAMATFAEMDIPFDGSHITSCVNMMLPTARGSVSIRSKDCRDNPIIDPNCLSTEVDRTMIRAGVRRAIKAARVPEAKYVIESQTMPDGYLPLHRGSSDQEIDAFVRRCACTW